MPEVIKGMAVVSDSSTVRQRLELYLRELRHIKPKLSGNDLQNMGVIPGKKMGRILRALQEARIDQTISSREEEKALVQSLL
jgi:tRNA nucleotidyltransferase/poly(A) polymerase